MTAENISKKLGIKESVKGIYKIDDDQIIHTELRIIRYSPKTEKKIWEHDSHYDVITKVIIAGKSIEIHEFNGTKYTIDAESGKVKKDLT
jgi:hypothetical protein